MFPGMLGIEAHAVPKHCRTWQGARGRGCGVCTTGAASAACERGPRAGAPVRSCLCSCHSGAPCRMHQGGLIAPTRARRTSRPPLSQSLQSSMPPRFACSARGDLQGSLRVPPQLPRPSAAGGHQPLG